MSEDERYHRAKRKVEQLKGFYGHAVIYLIVNAGLALINLLSGGGWWFYWPLVGWGIGLAAHGVSVFWLEGFLGVDWEEKKIREIMEKQEKK